MGVPKEILINMFEKMLLSRIVEEKIIDLYRTGIKGLYHLAIGQEAVAVGVCTALKKDDYVFTTHRGKGHYIAKGGDIKALFAEFLEKQTGCNRGKGGPMHIIDPSVGMLGANGIVGASIPRPVELPFLPKGAGVVKSRRPSSETEQRTVGPVLKASIWPGFGSCP